MKDKTFIGLIFTACAIGILFICFSMVGKYQLCKLYFTEMNRVACFFTQLPAVTPRNR